MRKREIIDIRDRSLNIMIYSRRGCSSRGEVASGTTRARQVMGIRNTIDPKRDIINTYDRSLTLIVLTSLPNFHHHCLNPQAMVKKQLVPAAVRWRT